MSLFNHHFDAAAKQRIAAYEASIPQSDVDWTKEADTEVKQPVVTYPHGKEALCSRSSGHSW